MATRKVWYGLSAVLMIICFISFYFRGLNLALDFTGGVSVEVTFSGQPMDAEKVRSTLTAANFHEPQVQTFGSSREVAIRLQSEKGSPEIERGGAGSHHQGADAARPERGDSSAGYRGRAGGRRAAQQRDPGARSRTLIGIFIYLIFRFHCLAPVGGRHPRGLA